MLGQKLKCFKEHPTVSLETLVPNNNFYRLIEAKLDQRFSYANFAVALSDRNVNATASPSVGYEHEIKKASHSACLFVTPSAGYFSSVSRSSSLVSVWRMRAMVHICSTNIRAMLP